MAGKVEPTSFPVGTPDAIARTGESPLVWGSCAAQRSVHPKHGGPLVGCAFYATCEFQKDRPRNYGVYIENSDGVSATNIVSCVSYMGAYHERAKHQEQSGEVIAIIAEEGDEIEQVVTLSADPINCNKNGNMAMKQEKRIVKVPKFPEPGEEGSLIPPQEMDSRAYARKMIALRRQRHIDKRMGVPVNHEGVVDDGENVTEPIMVKRGPGRQPKHVAPEE